MSRKNKVKKKKTVGDHILTIVLIVAICIFCYAAFNLYHIYTEYKKGTDEYNSISEMAVTERDPDQVEEMNQPDEQPVAPVRVDFDSLRSINEDVIGWIYMEALPEISYPVVQGEDNNFYLHQTYEKNYNFAGTILSFTLASLAVASVLISEFWNIFFSYSRNSLPGPLNKVYVSLFTEVVYAAMISYR